MHPLQVLIESLEWASKNTAHNLDFIPDDKLAWKPEPDAKSALEIVHECITTISWMHGTLTGVTYDPTVKIPVPETRAAAQEQLLEVSAKYLALLQSFGAADLEGNLELSFGPFPRSRALALPILDLTHHHGQLAYIQTLLGDTVSHFYEFGS